MQRADYIAILTYYKKYVPSMSFNELKTTAESILANKLCRCIKKVNKSYKDKDEKRAIGICKNSVIKRKNLKIYKFHCKKKPRLVSKKGTSKKIEKLKSKTRKIKRSKK